jgi:hypothetical protein
VSRRDPDWVLIRRLVRITVSAPGGGLHRAELADRASIAAWSDVFKHSLMVAYSRHLIDFCGQYAAAPANRKDTS